MSVKVALEEELASLRRNFQQHSSLQSVFQEKTDQISMNSDKLMSQMDELKSRRMNLTSEINDFHRKRALLSKILLW